MLFILGIKFPALSNHYWLTSGSEVGGEMQEAKAEKGRGICAQYCHCHHRQHTLCPQQEVLASLHRLSHVAAKQLSWGAQNL